MKKIIIAAAAATAVLVAMPAAAQGWYAEANLGPNFNGHLKVQDSGAVGKVKLKKGWLLSGVVGRDLADGVSVEAEGLVTRNKIRAVTLQDGSQELGGYRVTTAAALVNVVYTAPLAEVAPYIGVGVGYGDSSVDYNAQYDDEQGLVWQVKGGAKFALSPKASANLGLRYVEGARIKQDGAKITPRQTALTVGIHYGF